MANKNPIGSKKETFHYPKGLKRLTLHVELSIEDWDTIPLWPSKAHNVRMLIWKKWGKNDLSPL